MTAQGPITTPIPTPAPARGRLAAVTLRPARPDDARALAELIVAAGGGVPEMLWAGMAEPGESVLDVGERRARRDVGGFSWRRALVAEEAGRVLGMILAYPLPPRTPGDEAEIATAPETLRPFLELELEAPESWYVNAFAVVEGRRGEGLGARLLGASLDLARAAGLREASVQYFSQNPRAGDFYRRHGFVDRAARPLVPHPACRYDERTALLVKDLARAA